MFAFVRGLHRRAVVVGTVVLLAMLAFAVPASAVPPPMTGWKFHSKHLSTGKCREVGEDLYFQGRVGDFRCIPYINSRRVDLQVRYFR